MKLCFSWVYIVSLVQLGRAQNITDDIIPLAQDLYERAPQATALPPAGAAAIINSQETHYYQVNKSMVDQTLTLSICDASPDLSSTLTLTLDGEDFVTEFGLASTYIPETSNGTIMISAPALSGQQKGQWSYQLGVGNSASYMNYDESLYFVDSDYANILLVTGPFINMTESLVNLFDNQTAYNLNASQFDLFVYDSDTNRSALSQSYCGLQHSPLLNQNNADVSQTNRSSTIPRLRGQYLLKGLNNSSPYDVYLGLPSSGSLGGVLFPSVNTVTKTSTSCQVVYNMSFCSDMAFAVPGNASAFTNEELTSFYDSMAYTRYQNFSKTMDQVPCDLSEDLRYSPFRNCSDCDLAYKNWLCSVSIPRCADFDNPASYLATRNPGQSRNPDIDLYIMPGPYKEILPCKELCYQLVQDCPASLGFGCPSGKYLSQSYGNMSSDGDVTCSYPGAVYQDDGSWILKPNMLAIYSIALFFLVL